MKTFAILVTAKYKSVVEQKSFTLTSNRDYLAIMSAKSKMRKHLKKYKTPHQISDWIIEARIIK